MDYVLDFFKSYFVEVFLGIFVPIGIWYFRARVISLWWKFFRDSKMRKMLKTRVFAIVYNPEKYDSSNHEKGWKEISFEADGTIYYLKKDEECYEAFWEFKRGVLIIYDKDRDVYSKFKFNETSGKFESTNDVLDTEAMMNQFIIVFGKSDNAGSVECAIP